MTTRAASAAGDISSSERLTSKLRRVSPGSLNSAILSDLWRRRARAAPGCTVAIRPALTVSINIARESISSVTLGERSSCLINVAEGQLRLPKEGEPCIGRHHTRGATLQQTGGQFGFQAADLLAQCRRDDAEILGGLAHAAALDHAGEVAKLTYFH